MQSKKSLFSSQAIFLFFCLIFILGSFLLIRLIANAGIHRLGDFDIRAFYTGGQMVKNHITTGFYSPEMQYDWQRKDFYVPEQAYLLPFVYPSFVALPFALLAFLPAGDAYQATAALNVLLAIITIYLIFKTLNIFSSRLSTLVACASLLCYIPLWDALFQGQFSFLLFLSLVLGWILLKKRQYFLAGLILSLLMARPHLLIIPFLVFLWKKEWHVLAGIIGGCLVLTGVSMLMTGPNFISEYTSIIISYASVAIMYDHPQTEPTIRGAIQAMFHTSSFAKILPFYLLSSLLMLGILLSTLRGKLTIGKLFDLQWAMLIVIVYLTSAHTNPHDMLILMFPAFILSHYAITQALSRHQPLWKLTLLSCLFVASVLITGALCVTPLVIILVFGAMILLMKQINNAHETRLR